MSINFNKTNIFGLIIINAHQYDDDFFSLKKFFQKDVFEKINMPTDFREASIISYKRGTLRGLHYQKNPSQGKLIYIISGVLFVVALDLREESERFGQYEKTTLVSEQSNAVYIPENFATGILSLTDNTIISYNCTGEYIPENCGGILWNDPELNIPWPIDKLDSPVLLSEKDKKLQTFYEYQVKKKYVF
jgi:dTDP-4-dehydrorhamnose 3,5-epimerase